MDWYFFLQKYKWLLIRTKSKDNWSINIRKRLKAHMFFGVGFIGIYGEKIDSRSIAGCFEFSPLFLGSYGLTF